MAPTTSNEIIRMNERELSRRAEATRRRREAQELRTDPGYPDVMRTVDEANVAARRGLVAEAQRLFALAYGFIVAG